MNRTKTRKAESAELHSGSSVTHSQKQTADFKESWSLMSNCTVSRPSADQSKPCWAYVMWNYVTFDMVSQMCTTSEPKSERNVSDKIPSLFFDMNSKQNDRS